MGASDFKEQPRGKARGACTYASGVLPRTARAIRNISHGLPWTAHAVRNISRAVPHISRVLRWAAHAVPCISHALRWTAHAIRNIFHGLPLTAHAVRRTPHAIPHISQPLPWTPGDVSRKQQDRGNDPRKIILSQLLTRYTPLSIIPPSSAEPGEVQEKRSSPSLRGSLKTEKDGRPPGPRTPPSANLKETWSSGKPCSRSAPGGRPGRGHTPLHSSPPHLAR